MRAAQRFRQHYAAFHRLTADHGVTVLFPHHTVKGSNRIRTPLDLTAGSKGWTQFAPMVWQIVRPQDEDYFVLEMTKGRKVSDKPALEYWCESWEQNMSVPVAVIGGPARLRIRDMLDEGSLAGSIIRAHKFEEAKAAIRGLLVTGPKSRVEMEAALDDAGIKRPTWKRAASAMSKVGELLYDPWRLAESESVSSKRSDSRDSSDPQFTMH